MAPRTRQGGTAEERRARATELRQADLRKSRRRRAIWISATAVALVVIVIAVFVGVKVAGGGSSGSADADAGVSGPATPAIVKAVSGVPAATLATVGAGDIQTPPKVISAPALTAGGTPRVLYIGAEYCPYCAAERWPMVVALSRFGTFTGLGTTHSASRDVYPNTPTLSFHGATYSSDVLSFTGVEETTNVPAGNSYTPLDTPTAADEALIEKYDAPPYVDASSNGAIPFVDLGGKYLISGASYNPQVLAGKTPAQVATALADPTSAIAKSVDGTANVITARLCTLTGDKPAAVCGTGVIKGLQSTLDAKK